MAMIKYLMLAPILASVLVTPDVNLDYQGTVNPYTGAPMENAESAQTQKVTLPDGGIYDRDSHTFNYSVSGYQTPVSCSVANGMIVTDAVSVVIPEDMNAILYSFGQEVSDIDYQNIATPGSYSLVVKGIEADKQVLTFDIVATKTGRITAYTLPEGFALQTVSIDDVVQAPNYSRTVDLQKEGKYNISYRCTSIGVGYTLKVDIDHTYPEVEFDGLKGSVAYGPVKVLGMADGDRMKVIFNGEEVAAPSNGVLRSVGNYVVTVSDDAGNSVTKEFVIRLYLNMQGGIFVALALSLFVAAGAFMYVSRKRLRVR